MVYNIFYNLIKRAIMSLIKDTNIDVVWTEAVVAAYQAQLEANPLSQG
jgi:hypothetical protein